MAVPTQLGIVPLFIVMAKLGWIGQPLGRHHARRGQRVRRVLDDAVPPRRRCPTSSSRPSRVDGASTLPDLLVRRAARARPAAGDAGAVHLHGDLDQLLLAVHRARPGQPHAPVALQQLQAAYYVDYSLVLAGAVLMARSRCSSCSSSPGASSSPASCKEQSRDDRQTQPLLTEPTTDLAVARTAPCPDFVLGRGHRGVPDRGRRRRGRPQPTRIWDTFCRDPGAVDGRRHRRRRLRPLPPVCREDVALMSRPRRCTAYRFSIAWPRVQPDGRARSTRPGLDFYDRLVDELLDARHRAVADALPLGPAAGARGRGRLAQPRHRRPLRRVRRARCTTASATGSRTGPRSTSRGARPSSATPPASTPRDGRTRRPGWPPRTTCCSGHGLAAAGAARPRTPTLGWA